MAASDGDFRAFHEFALQAATTSQQRTPETSSSHCDLSYDHGKWNTLTFRFPREKGASLLGQTDSTQGIGRRVPEKSAVCTVEWGFLLTLVRIGGGRLLRKSKVV
jgi:hypothetical protein